VSGVPEGLDQRLTVSVGRREFEELNRDWAGYVAATRASSSQVDPVVSLRRTGEVLRSLDRLLASIDRAEAKPPSSAAVDPCD
jgi:hypothetical protein